MTVLAPIEARLVARAPRGSVARGADGVSLERIPGVGAVSEPALRAPVVSAPVMWALVWALVRA